MNNGASTGTVYTCVNGVVLQRNAKLKILDMPVTVKRFSAHLKF